MIDISALPALPIRQDSVSAQLEDLRLVANRLGMYDAADAISQMFPRLKDLQYGCHVDAMTENLVDKTCVIDSGMHNDCIYAKPGMRREQCEYWRLLPSSMREDGI